MKHPREIDAALVDAYLARRALDYLVGFTLSPVLWRKLPGARSAGRVQSVALRLVCDRELEIEKFIPARILVARRRRSPRRAATRSRPAWSGPTAEDPAARHRLGRTTPRRSSATSKPRPSWSARSRRSPPSATPTPPFTTSTLQQEASRKLGFAARAHDAARAAALRGHRHRRRDGRPDHLYAHRRRADGR